MLPALYSYMEWERDPGDWGWDLTGDWAGDTGLMESAVLYCLEEVWLV